MELGTSSTGIGANWTTTSYDALGRPLVITAPDGTTTTHQYGLDQDSGSTLYRIYDDVTDANGHRSRSRADIYGRRYQVLEYNGDSTATTSYSRRRWRTGGQTMNGVTTAYFQELWEQTIGGASTRYYTFNGQMVAMRDSTNAVTYLHGDHLGSVSLITNSSGAVVNKQDFDPWGKVRNGRISATTLNYTGQRLDGTGLLYYHARYYDPALARFVSADSIIPGQTDTAGTANPQNLNRYSYVNNSPLSHTDPSGQAVGCNDGCGGGGYEAEADVARPSAPERMAEPAGRTAPEAVPEAAPAGEPPTTQMGPEGGGWRAVGSDRTLG